MSAREGMSIFHATFVTDVVWLASLARGTARSNRKCGRLRITLPERRQPIVTVSLRSYPTLRQNRCRCRVAQSLLNTYVARSSGAALTDSNADC